MTFRQRRYAVEQELPVSPDELWRWLSNTDHLNRAIGLPAVTFGPTDPQSEELHRTASAKALGVVRLRWREYPFDWVRNQSYAVLRVFEKGPFSRFWGGVELHPGKRGTLVRAFAELTPGNAVGGLLASVIGPKGVKDTLGYCGRLQALVASGAAYTLPPPKARSHAQRQRLEALLNQVTANPVDPGLAVRLKAHLLEASDEEVLHMRPFALAQAWGAARPEVLRLFLYSTRAGLLNLSWELLCPNCRVPKAQFSALHEVQTRYHCDTCGVDWEADFAQFMELRFSVHPSVRRALDEIYCIGGPANTPHILAQQTLGPGERRELRLELGSEPHRVRLVRLNQMVPLQPADAALREETLSYDETGWQPDRLRFPPGPVALTLCNQSTRTILAVVETVSRDSLATTAAEVTALQEFRDLFSAEVLAPGVPTGIQSVSLLFTDLKGSTQMYETVGDAPAYGHVRKHFDILMRCIREQGGSLVKTIGDAVMAVFPYPERAARAGLDMLIRMEEFNRSRPEAPPLIVKLGIHHGPAVAINANGRLDYFGRTVNVAARVQQESLGGDLVLAEEVYQDTSIQEVLREYAVEATPFLVTPKGIEKPMPLRRVTLKRHESQRPSTPPEQNI